MPFKPTTLVCLHCGTTFEGVVRVKGRGRYCTRRCAGLAQNKPSVANRFWPKVDKGGPVPPRLPDLGPCWLWTGSKLDAGYGYMQTANKRVLAHRVSYELAHGGIPERMVIDHLCERTSCVNPRHLEPVTQLVNFLRSKRWRRPERARLIDPTSTCRACRARHVS